MPGAALRFIARLCRSEAAAGELTRSVGIRMAPTCPAVCAPGSESAPPAGSCGRVTCRLQAAARHLPKRQRSWLGAAAPAPQAPCTHRPSLFSSFSPPPRLSPSSLSSPFFSPSPPLSCILFFPKADTRRSKWEEGLSLLTNSSSAWWWRSWLPLAAPPLLPPALLLLLPGL